MAKYLLALQISATKNGTISMISTKEGMISVRNDVLKKRNITPPTKDCPFTFEKPTMVIVEDHKKGDYIFGGDGSATQDSSRTKFQAGLVDKDAPDANEPAYSVGDKPTWSEDGRTVRSFISVENYKAQMEVEKLEKELASM